MAGHDNPSLKRKRSHGDDNNDIQLMLKGKLHRGLHEAKKAAKKAKVFETQKLVKKLRSLGPDAVLSERKLLESLLEESKNVDYGRLGAFALFNKLKKDKVLSRHAQFQAVMEAEHSEMTDASLTMDSTLRAHLLSSKVLSAEVNSIISALRMIISPTSEPLSTEAQNSGITKRSGKAPKLSYDQEKTPAPLDAFEESDDGLRPIDDNGVAHTTFLSDEPTKQAEDGWESGTVDEFQSDSGNDAGDSNVVRQSSGEAARSSTKASSSSSSRPGKSSAAKPVESVFLPSLAVGFTRGDSDSEFSDSEAAVADSIRKNRRGQRARRAIWEKKYGNNAKHLRADKQSTEQFISPTDGANPRGPLQRTRRYEQRRHEPSSRSSERPPEMLKPMSSAPMPPRLSRKDARHDDKPLHPSWEAKRRLKELQNPSILISAGTRIKFDD